MINVPNDDAANEQKAERKSKPGIAAPCAYEMYDEVRKKNILVYPAVTCGFHCAHCGWNPAVAKKRVKKMQAELAARKKVK